MPDPGYSGRLAQAARQERALVATRIRASQARADDLRDALKAELRGVRLLRERDARLQKIAPGEPSALAQCLNCNAAVEIKLGNRCGVCGSRRLRWGDDQANDARDPMDATADEETILDGVAARHGVTVDAIRGKSRLRSHVDARHEAMQRLYDAGLSMSRVGAILGRDHATVHHALKKTAR